MARLSLLIGLAAILVPALSKEVFYYFGDSDADDAVTDCVSRGIRLIEEGTCIQFTETSSPDASSFIILHSSECAWQPSNRTLHFSPRCVSPHLCLELLGKALEVDRPQHDLLHHINHRHNCTGTCSNHCEHGGQLSKDCKCACGYGFEGERCEKLTRERHFNDEACGRIEAEDQGSLKLSTYPGDHQKATFCQWLVQSEDPWATIELAFEELDMDNEGVPPGQKCNDILTVYGAGDSVTIPCDGSAVANMRSTSNWVLVELRTNPWSLDPHRGPSIRYSLHSRAKALARSEEMSSSSVSAPISAAVASLLLPLCF